MRFPGLLSSTTLTAGLLSDEVLEERGGDLDEVLGARGGDLARSAALGRVVAEVARGVEGLVAIALTGRGLLSGNDAVVERVGDRERFLVVGGPDRSRALEPTSARDRSGGARLSPEPLLLERGASQPLRSQSLMYRSKALVGPGPSWL